MIQKTIVPNISPTITPKTTPIVVPEPIVSIPPASIPYTSFDSIYSLFFAQIDDYEMGAMEEEDALEFLYNQLLISTTGFTCCKKDLTSLTPFTVGEMPVNFGTGNTISIIQGLPLIHKNLEFNLYENGIMLEKILDYTVSLTYQNSEVVDIIITKVNPKISSNVVISWTFSGQFNCTLSLDEQYILAMGMLQSWLNHKIYREQNLRMVIGDTDYKGYSSANLLGKLMNLRDSLKLELRERKMKYSYKGFTGLY